ncbi:MAG TPA: CDP-glycerol glycerophosphotransferase family protein [Candidatus Saccharimonadales bacterium]|nr:CDP-glycerol glycerophosphotransferase family protein [Candidatus Saccharimonadales bacterium]
MTQTARPAIATGPSPLRITELRWERVQLVIRVATAGGSVPDGLRLRRRGGHDDEWMTPTSVRPAGDGPEQLVRFNVMQGPGLMPLEPGEWVLETGDLSGSRGIPTQVVIDDPSLRPVDVVGRFELTRGVYTATPMVDPGDGRFALMVSLGPPVLRPGQELSPPVPWTLTRVRNRIIRRLRRPMFQVLFRLARLVARRNGRRVLFSSDSRADLGGNLLEVYDRMVARGLDRDYELLRIFKPSIAERRPMSDRFRLPWLLARADVVLIDDYQPVIYRIDDPAMRIVQLWHASGAFKTVGYSRVGKPGGPSPYSRVHKNYTHAIVSSDHDVPFYAEAFGIPEARVVPTGIPRMDRFFDAEKQAAAREAAYERFPAARGRRTILFAPTFRGPPRLATYGTEHLDFAALHGLAVEQDAVVIFKMHPFVREPLEIPQAYTDRLVDATTTDIDVNDLLFVVDLLVTDYSSIVFEFSTLGRPMLFFAYDLDEYVAERDFYVPFEEFVPGRIVRTFPELLDAIRRDDVQLDKVDVFARRHFAHLDGSSTDRVIDELVIGR